MAAKLINLLWYISYLFLGCCF